MLKKTLTTATALALVAAGLLAAGITTAHAQYPPTSAAGITIAVSNPNTPAGGSTTIATVVEDSTGTTVSGTVCAFTIVSQPGTDATLNPSSATTNASGVASTTLAVGSKPGNVVVQSQCGSITGQTTVVAGVASVPAAPTAGEQPESGPSRLPSAGTGDAADGGLTALAMAVLGAMVITGAGAIYAGRRR